MSQPTLSVVIATYNGKKYLREQLDSLCAQTLKSDEVLVIDDSSNDGTLEILEEYRDKYGIKFIVNEKNLGVNGNFEKGIKSCNGDYISLCDQDDVWFKNKNEILYKKLYELEQEEIGNGHVDKNGLCTTPIIVSSRNTFVDEHLNFHHNTELGKDTSDYRDTILSHLSQGSSMMFNRACLKYILPLPDYESGICYDTYIGYIIAMVGHKYDLKQSLMYYRVHGNNVTASLDFKRSSFNLKRKRSVSIVPLHMIKTFQKAKPIIELYATRDKINYVNRIIDLSQDISVFKRVYLLLTTPHIPMRKKFYSLKASLLNNFFAQ